MSSQSNVPASATLSTSTEIPPVESSPQIDLNNFAPEDFYVAHEMKLQAQVQETKIRTNTSGSDVDDNVDEQEDSSSTSSVASSSTFGSVTGSSASSRGLSRFLNEAELHEQIESGMGLATLLQLFCDTSVDATIVMDRTGIIITLNREALSMFGYNRWEMVGRNVSMLMEPRVAKVHDLFIARYLRTKIKRIIGEKRGGLKAKRKDGTMFQIILKVHEYADENTRVFIGVIRDVSRSRQAADYLALLDKVLPRHVVPTLLGDNVGRGVAERYRATVGFIDLLDYIDLTDNMSPVAVVRMLAEIWSLFDNLLDEYECERVKTIGPCFMFVSNLVDHVSAHAVNGTLFAQACIAALAEHSPAILRHSLRQDTGRLSARAGVATGELIGGVVAGERLAFDVWGSTVNLASRLNYYCARTDSVVVDERTYQESKYCIEYEPSKKVDLKGLGTCTAYELVGVYQKYAGLGHPGAKSARFRRTSKLETSSKSSTSSSSKHKLNTSKQQQQ